MKDSIVRARILERVSLMQDAVSYYPDEDYASELVGLVEEVASCLIVAGPLLQADEAELDRARSTARQNRVMATLTIIRDLVGVQRA